MRETWHVTARGGARARIKGWPRPVFWRKGVLFFLASNTRGCFEAKRAGKNKVQASQPVRGAAHTKTDESCLVAELGHSRARIVPLAAGLRRRQGQEDHLEDLLAATRSTRHPPTSAAIDTHPSPFKTHTGHLCLDTLGQCVSSVASDEAHVCGVLLPCGLVNLLPLHHGLPFTSFSCATTTSRTCRCSPPLYSNLRKPSPQLHFVPSLEPLGSCLAPLGRCARCAWGLVPLDQTP